MSFLSSYQQIAIFFIGVIAGFFSSSPIGAINILVAQFALSKQSKRVLAFVFGVIVVDVMFAIFASAGYAKIVQESAYHRWLQIGGGFILVFIGFFIFFQKANQTFVVSEFSLKEQDMAKGYLVFFRDFAYGSILCASNPAFLVFWLFVANQISNIIHIENSLFLFVLYGLGIVIGDLFWFILFYEITKKSFSFLSFQGIKIVKKIFAILMLVFGLYSVAQQV